MGNTPSTQCTAALGDVAGQMRQPCSRSFTCARTSRVARQGLVQRRRRDCHSTCLHADFHFPGQASFFDDRRREPDTAQIADAHRACFYGTLPSVSTMYPRLSGGMVSRVRLENTTGWRPVSRGLAPKCYLTLSYDHMPRRRTHRRARTDRGRVVVVHKNRQKGQDPRRIARAWTSTD